ncbi:MAG: response regulator transcription factor [Colwellia sp.]
MDNKILLIDNNVELTIQLQEYLGNEGFDVCICNNSTEGLAKASSTHYNLIILDIVGSDFDGLQLLKSLKQIDNCPVMVVTTRDEQFDRIYALEIGADDYVLKPLHPRELLARMKVIMRRVTNYHREFPPVKLNINKIMVCHATREAYCDNHLLQLTGSEFEVLYFLMANAGKITSKERIGKSVFGRTVTYDDRSIDMHICNLRKKIAFFGQKHQIKTIRGIGYVFLTSPGVNELYA